MQLGTAKEVQQLARWFIGLRILSQFHLAGELLYGGDQPGEEVIGAVQDTARLMRVKQAVAADFRPAEGFSTTCIQYRNTA